MAIFPWKYFHRAQLILIAVGQARDVRAEAETDERRDSDATWYRDFSFSSSNIVVRDDELRIYVLHRIYVHTCSWGNHIQEIPYDTKFVFRAGIN